MTKRIDVTLAVLLIAATLLLSIVPLAPLVRADTTATTGCSKEISQAAANHQATFNQQAAIAVAESDVGFLQYQQYHPVFSSVYDNWSFDTNCQVTLNYVGLVFQLTNSSKTQVLVAQESPKADQVTSFSVQHNIGSASWANQGKPSTFWSGYEMGGNSGGSTPEYQSNAEWSIPSASQPYSGACQGTPDCSLLVWTGLVNSAYGGTGIAQAGTYSELGCFAGQTCSIYGINYYGLWYEFWHPQQPLVQCDQTREWAGDSITAYVTNEASYGGNVNYWGLIVTDSTINKACTVNHHYDSTIGTPYLAEFMLEREVYGSGYYTLPKFSDAVMTGGMWTSSPYTAWSNGWFNEYIMENGSPLVQNIYTTGVNTGNTYTSTWYSSYGT